MTTSYKIDPKLDLMLEKTVNLPAHLIWKAWTTPEYLKPWFCPKPWTVTDCEIDLRPGGIFRTTMKSPEGQEFPNLGCYLEVIENKKLTWTDTLLPGYRPAVQVVSGAGFAFTASIILEVIDSNTTKYTAICLHRNEEDRIKHENMGFYEGWSICLDQLVEFVLSNNLQSL